MSLRMRHASAGVNRGCSTAPSLLNRRLAGEARTQRRRWVELHGFTGRPMEFDALWDVGAALVSVDQRPPIGADMLKRLAVQRHGAQTRAQRVNPRTVHTKHTRP